MLENLVSARYLSATKQFAVFFLKNPTRAVRLPAIMYATMVAIEAADGGENQAITNLMGALKVSHDKAGAMIDAAERLSLIHRRETDGA